MNTSTSFNKKTMELLTQKEVLKENPADVLADLLSITKSAVYRRIDDKVPFTFREMVTLAQKLGLSLDEIAGLSSPAAERLSMRVHDHLNPTQTDFKYIETFIQVLKKVNRRPDSRMESLTNILPYMFYLHYPAIARFYTFKWVYQYGYSMKNIPYRDIHIHKTYSSLQKQFVKELQQIASSSFVLDPLMFYYLVNDIHYFRNLYLITEEDLLLIRDDLFRMLDEMEWMCRNGHFRSTGKKVSFFVSNTNFTSNYCYIQCGPLTVSLIKAFLLNDLATDKKETFAQIQGWIQSQKRYGTLISQSGERLQILYFRHQRELVESLTNPEIIPEDFLFKCNYGPA